MTIRYTGVCWFVALLLASTATGCFDSRWLDEQEAQKRTKARLKPATLEPQKARSEGSRTAAVRAYATRAYSAETLHWEAQFARLLRDANQVLEPALGVTLVNAGTNLWAPASGDAVPTSALQDLEREDTGEGAEWVVGFVQSVPKVVTDYHSLGVAAPFSKYLVLRGSADAAELQGLREGTNDEDGALLYSERRHHKIMTVFLHELAHTLGAVHRTARDTIMSPVYDSGERGFDGVTVGLLQIAAPHFLAGTPYASAPLVAAYLEKNDAGWVRAERDQWLARLAPLAQARTAGAYPAAPPSASAAAPGPARPATPVPFATLPAADQALYASAVEAETRDARGAWKTALPLFETHPRVVEVQDLRCRLAKLQHFFPGVAEAHCERLEGLLGTAAPGRP